MMDSLRKGFCAITIATVVTVCLQSWPLCRFVFSADPASRGVENHAECRQTNEDDKKPESLQGTWKVVSDITDGKATSLDQQFPKIDRVVFVKDRLTLEFTTGRRERFDYAIDGSRTPMEIDASFHPETHPGELHHLDGILTVEGLVRICFDKEVRTDGEPHRPTEFLSKEGSGTRLIALRRENSRFNPDEPLEVVIAEGGRWWASFSTADVPGRGKSRAKLSAGHRFAIWPEQDQEYRLKRDAEKGTGNIQFRWALRNGQKPLKNERFCVNMVTEKTPGFASLERIEFADGSLEGIFTLRPSESGKHDEYNVFVWLGQMPAQSTQITTPPRSNIVRLRINETD